MRKSKFSESQIVGILKDAESGVPVADLLRKYGVSKATFFKWRNKCGGASVSDVKRLRELEAENAKLKRMYADLALENAALIGAIGPRSSMRISSNRSPKLRALTVPWLEIYHRERPHDSLPRVPPLTFLPTPSSAAQSPFECSA